MPKETNIDISIDPTNWNNSTEIILERIKFMSVEASSRLVDFSIDISQAKVTLVFTRCRC